MILWHQPNPIGNCENTRSLYRYYSLLGINFNLELKINGTAFIFV